ncbi:right-handed parallel beta-helix repeat-containing protein, partial [Mesorhizobium sp.]|uniref:right-handed parallel beta-helix repeat-containing protein n=1 Tax=Mesorhizobium sp. TaxID=1871066 RepID=UPI00345BD011
MRAGYRRSSIARHLWKTTALTSLALALSGAAAYGDDAGLWQPQIRAIIGADNNGGNAALEGFIPIKQTAESVLFLDVRAKHDFKDAFGQDIGLGIRRIVNPDLMLGGYAYFNAESYGGTQFTGGTLGVEAVTPNFDAHVNVFVPIKGDSTDHSTSSTLSMVSNQLIEQISVLDHRDYAAWGIEGEIGAQVPVNLPDKHSLRLDIGGYHFEDPHGDDGSVTGAKAGIEYEIGDVFGTGTSLTFTGEVRNDNRDDTQFAGSVRLNIPFNPGHGSDTTGAIGTDPVYPVSEGLRKRVNERVRGDIGVRVQSQDKIGGSTTRVAINAATNAAFGKFYFADGGLAGAGTQADPTTLDDAVTKAGNGGFVVALGGSGNLTTAGVTLATGQTVIGGGQSVTAKLSGGGTATFNLGGSDGTIQGTNVANNVITLGTGNTLNGITITGGADGIFGNNVTGTTLTKVTVTGAGGNGAEFTGNSTNVKASDFTSTNNGLDGLHIEDNGTYNFTGTTLLSGNLDDGLDITGQGTYTFATVNALDNTDRGITVQGTSSGGSFTTTGGTISGNGGVGVYIDPITAHVVLDSISQTGGTSGVVLDHVSGSFTVNG